MPRLQNPFLTLGLTPAVVKKAKFEGAIAIAKVMYLQNSRLHHPDTGGDRRLFEAVAEAWELLQGDMAQAFYDEYISSQAAKRAESAAQLRLEHEAELEQWRGALERTLEAPHRQGNVFNPTAGLRVLLRGKHSFLELTFEGSKLVVHTHDQLDQEEMPSTVKGGMSVYYYSNGATLKSHGGIDIGGKELEADEGPTNLREGWYQIGPVTDEGTNLYSPLEPSGRKQEKDVSPFVLIRGHATRVAADIGRQRRLSAGEDDASIAGIEVSSLVSNPQLLSFEWKEGAALLAITPGQRIDILGTVVGIYAPT